MASQISFNDFDLIFNRYHNELFKVSYHYVKNYDDAQDIVQNVFIKLIENKNKFSNDDFMKYWLIRVTINESINFLKTAHHRHVMVDNEQVEHVKDDNSVNSETGELTKEVYKLEEKYQTVIILYYYDRLKVNEIAQILKITESNVKKRLERARNILKERCEGYGR